MIACVHQPNYLPWRGFFAKIAASDVYVVLDSAQFPRSSVCNRVRVAGNGPPLWLSVPVRAPRDLTHTVGQKEIDHGRDWVRAHLGTLRGRYGRCPYFAGTFEAVAGVLAARPGRLVDLNLTLVRALLEMLGLGPRLVLASALGVEGRGSERIVRLCRAVGAEVYLAGRGAAYDDLDVYRRAGIAYRRALYRDVPYPQRGREGFEPGLSIVDALFELGPERTRSLLSENLTIETVSS